MIGDRYAFYFYYLYLKLALNVKLYYYFINIIVKLAFLGLFSYKYYLRNRSKLKRLINEMK
jgi:hypothetical protein